jgi:ABC-type histidine transport system ATPase subunit
MQNLRIEDLHKSYGEQEVLKGISLTAQTGEVVSIIGASGSGKSTLLRCINFLEQPDSGRICLGADEIRIVRDRHGGTKAADRERLRRMRSRLGMVFQHFNLWSHMTVLQNITEGPTQVLGLGKTEAHKRARYYLGQVGLIGIENRYPVQLSGGQQQRVAIARALAMEPEILLFDEPTSALDPELVGEVLKVMRQLAAEGRTMIIVTHEMRFAREVSSKTIFLHAGKIEEQGAPDRLFMAPESARLRAFLSSQCQ